MREQLLLLSTQVSRKLSRHRRLAATNAATNHLGNRPGTPAIIIEKNEEEEDGRMPQQ